MAAATSIILGTLAAASVANQVEANRVAGNTAVDQKKDVAAQRQKQEVQQAAEKKKVKDQKTLAKRKKGAEESLESSKNRQARRQASSGREGTILTEGLGAGEAAGEAAGTLLGGSDKKGKTLLGA